MTRRLRTNAPAEEDARAAARAADGLDGFPLPKDDPPYGPLIASSILVRLVVDTGVQLFNPFLAQIAQGLNTNVVVLGQMVGLRSAMGLSSPIFGALADKHGFRLIMRIGLLLSGLGALTIGFSNHLGSAALGMMAWGIGVAMFVPTLQAYVSAQLPYEKRARGIGMLEYSWALAGIVGLFTMGQLMAAVGWRAPFWVLGGGMLIAGLAFGLLPSARSDGTAVSVRDVEASASVAAPTALWGRVRRFFAFGENARSAYATIFAGALFFIAAMQIMISHGAWLTAEYGLGPAQLGSVALVLGLADLCGSGLVSLITDRLGKRRSVLLGSAGATVGFALLPFFNTTLTLAVLGLAAARFCFEFAVVSNISLLSEQVPSQRGKVMTLGAAFNLLGVTLAGVLGPWLYVSLGLGGLSGVSVLLATLSIGIVLSRVRERAGAPLAV